MCSSDLDGRIKPDVVAPGVEIWSTDVSGTYTNKQGTSMGTPVTTGVAALLYQARRPLAAASSRLTQLGKWLKH